MLQGFAEFVDISVPPKLYLTNRISGSTEQTYWTGIPGNDCAGTQTGLIRSSWSGSCQYGASVVGVVSNTKNEHHETDGCFGTSDVNNALLCGDNGGPGPTTTVVTTRTQIDYITPGQCGINSNFGPCGFNGLKYGDGVTDQHKVVDLLDEDTDGNAISRIPGIGIWSGYVSCGSEPICCRTTWQLRGVGETSFEYVESRIKVRGAGPIMTHVSVKVDVLRKPYGTGVPYSLYLTLEDDPTTNPDGTFEVDFGVLPNDIGWETIASNCRVDVVT